MQTIRHPAVAGTFYPARREVLEVEVRALLAKVVGGATSDRPKALIVPHAGYVFSGAMAASAYACLGKYAAGINRVVLLGPAHRVAIRGLALPDADAFATPLGVVELDHEAIKVISSLKQVGVSSAAHLAEHSLEVQLPFLQGVLGEFKLVPLVVGHASAEQVAEVLDRLWGGAETLIVVSSDLSHFLSYEHASQIDRDTVDRILSLSELDSYQQACGATPINGMLLSAKRHGLRPHLIGLCNSGDTAGEKSRVVGYASLVFTEDKTDD